VRLVGFAGGDIIGKGGCIDLVVGDDLVRCLCLAGGDDAGAEVGRCLCALRFRFRGWGE